MLETRFIPKLDRSITRLGLGALPMGPLQLKLAPDEGARVVRAAVENGISFIDTACRYGTYEHIARGLRGWNAAVTIATKTHARQDRCLAERHIEEALRALGRDRIEIMLCHVAREPFTDDVWGPTLEALVRAREKGLIGMVGMSTHSVKAVGAATIHPEVDVIHPLINMNGLGIVDGTADEMLRAIRKAHDAGKFIYAMKTLGGGNFVGDREKALRYVFEKDYIDAAVVGMVTPSEVEWNVRFLSGLPIGGELARRTAMHNKKLNLLDMLCVGCGECVSHCENGALALVDGKAVVNHDLCILCGYCAPHCEMLAIRFV
ncbi:MAG: aldo/keto reductase [Desulfobacteraceae bacterium]|nr:aldo/keto reductase [Desulfobacteraceae bacterium]